MMEVNTVRVNGAEIRYEDRGGGPTLLLVHGFPLDRTMWSALAAIQKQLVVQASRLLRAAETAAPQNTCAQMGTVPFSRHRLIIPDLRGFGGSPPRGEAVSMELFADDLAALLDALAIDGPVVFCGLSMGGYIALQFWRKYRARLRGLVLCDTRAAADSPEAARARGILAERLLREGTAPLAETMLPRLTAESTRSRHPELLDRLRGMISAADPRGCAAALRGMAARPDMTPALGEIKCPTLLIVGREDAVTPPAEMQGMARAIPARSASRFPPPVISRRWRIPPRSPRRWRNFCKTLSDARTNKATFV